MANAPDYVAINLMRFVSIGQRATTPHRQRRSILVVNMSTCSECGAVYISPDDDCSRRFEMLLALDHSRQEPWGSRHALAFSAFALQHSGRFPPDVPERSWLILFSVYRRGADRARVFEAIRRAGRPNPNWDIPSLPAGKPDPHFAVTIADLGDFPAENYPDQLDRWCEATLSAWLAL